MKIENSYLYSGNMTKRTIGTSASSFQDYFEKLTCSEKDSNKDRFIKSRSLEPGDTGIYSKADAIKDKADEQESETKSNIITNPDGSRVLMITMKIGGMETTMNIEISKPTEFQNDNGNETEQGIPEQASDLQISDAYNV